jgi:hypothetical protein
MNTRARSSIAEHLGHWLGRGWRAYARGERRASAWLVSQGVPAAGAAIALWIVKIGILATLFYATFWLTLLALLALTAAWAMGQNAPADNKFELQIPTIEELRNEPGYDPNMYDDTSHEMYRNN